MKKILMTLLAGTLSLSVLVACGNDDADTTTENPDTEEVAQTEPAEESEEVAESSTDGDIVVPERQIDLRIGDTGIVDSVLGTYELTLNSAEIIGTELDGEEALLDELIVLTMTFKNIGDKSFNGEDEMIAWGLSRDLEGSQNTNAAASFESIEFFEGEIKPGETREAEFITDTYTADEYYFYISHGKLSAGSHNEVRFTFTDEEARPD